MASSPSPRLQSGVLSGRYAIRRKLGSGNMGTVYLAYDTAASRLVALKVLRAEQAAAPARRRMEAEFRAIASLRHPRIACAFDFGTTEAGGTPFYTREYVKGVPLSPGPPRDEEPAAFLRPILHLLEALEHVHAQGILHLDIHAGNLIVADEPARGSVLIDFGLFPSARRAFLSLTSGSWTGLPPEVLERGDLSPRTDLYLAGGLLRYRLTGRTSGEPRLPREIPGWGTRRTLELERITAKALQPSPEDRFASARDFREALQAALGESHPEGRREVEAASATLGRKEELRRMDDALRAAAGGGAAALWFLGREGLGKTRLLSEARLRAQLRGLATVEVRFPAQGGPDPLLRLALRATLPRGRRGGRRRVSSWLEALAPQFGGTPEERARRAAEAYFSEDGPPLVLLLDDVERADGDSRTLMEALVDEGARRRAGKLGGRGLAVFAASAFARTGRRSSFARSALRPLAAAPARRLFLHLLRPLVPAPGLLRRALARAAGSPLWLGRLAHALREEWGRSRAIPATADLPPVEVPGALLRDPGSLPREEREVLLALAALAREASREELARGLGRPPGGVERSLRRLARLEAVAGRGRGETRRYRLTLRGAGRERLGALPGAKLRALHERLVAFTAARAQPSAADCENLARHLLAAGRRAEGHVAALRAARRLREEASYERAVVLLEEAAAGESDLARRLRFTGEASAILEETGDHEKGIALLEPFARGGKDLPAPARVQVLRRLGVHYHRAGEPRMALRAFARAERLAHPRRDLGELVFIDSELAELHIFLGEYARAEEACRRGLRRLQEGGRAVELRDRTEVMLRASLGHIMLRRLRLPAAKLELGRALRLSARCGTLGDRAAILHNLGVAQNLESEFDPARRSFAEAERLLLRAGERRNLIKVSTNLALIAAKLGDREAAHLHIERAARMLRQHPGQRLECFVAYAKGVVAQLFGECEVAAAELTAAAALARRLGDRSLGSFAILHLAEALLALGRYQKAARLLGGARRRIEGEDSPALVRAAWSRLALAHAALGRPRQAAACRRRLADLPRTDLLYPEAWNDLFTALSLLFDGERPARLLDAAGKIFRRLRVPAGERLAELAALAGALAGGGADGARPRFARLERRARPPHHFLAVAEPLAAAEWHLARGEVEAAEGRLAAATSAIVGAPFLELDARLELLRARLEKRKGDLRQARRHLHRALHARDLILQQVPAAARGRFLAQCRFAAMEDLAALLKAPPGGELSTPVLRRARIYEGMVGTSPGLEQVVRAIERLRDQELPVLISGETGTGKELVARAIHRRSARGSRPFKAIHCACLPPELFESELFGHEAGAFTGAETSQPGLLEDADGGTVLLDHVDELHAASQAKLLRVLETGAVRPLGAAAERGIDVRYLSTARLDLRAAAERGTFRPDLYYRLAGVEIRVPPLRERREDVPELARHFLESHAARLDRPAPVLAEEALALLERHDWPGNARELEAVLVRALLGLSRSARIEARDVAPHLEGSSSGFFGAGLLGRGLHAWRRDLEREYLKQLFARHGGDPRPVMDELGVRRTKLYSWLRALGLEVRDLRRGR